ncbi:unnamed protein product [Allacma fusca]|uniref:Integrase catalytic domain-containing protein n=1 Tax=Allacma fusca TaxID=39272 RepID=A0A8J2LYM4_9HEXA|nr:unnamed protein product [Allacma fusca]
MADQCEILNSLRAKRKTLKSSLTKLKTSIEAYPPNPNLGLVEAHSLRLNEVWNDLTLNHYSILGYLKTAAEVESQESDYSGSETRVTDLRALLFSVPRPTPTTSAQSTRSVSTLDHKPTEIRLPTMDLPTFTGNLQDWMSFRDLFTATIGNNNALAAAQKLQYLKSCLRGDAARIVQSMQVTAENYAVAWDMQTQRYEHSRESSSCQSQRWFRKASALSSVLGSRLSSQLCDKCCVNRLNFPRYRLDLNIHGVANTVIGNARYYSQLTVFSAASDHFSIEVEAINMNQVTGMLPNLPCNIRRGPPNAPIAQETKLGWILYGKANAKSMATNCKHESTTSVSYLSLVDLDNSLQRFWEIEDTSSKRLYTLEEKLCEEEFARSHGRNTDGRYVVRLPFRTSPALGNSRDAAIRRLKCIERKLERDTHLKNQYHSFLQEYLDLGHMRLVPNSDLGIADSSKIARRDFGVDDLMSGGASVKSTLELQSQLIELTRRGGFQFQKWVSNSPEVIAAVPPEYRGTNLPLTIDSDESIKALGLRWNPATDNFTFIVEQFNFDYVLTKRSILSDLARIYDPAGWLSCVTVTAKIIMQKLWLLKTSWDDPIPPTIASEWGNYRHHLDAVERLNIPRCIILSDAKITELHGFCDASEKAYAACVYIRTVTNSEQAYMHLLTSKTKVAPLKQISLPRLELCGAVLLTRLLISTVEALHLSFDSVHAWSDSKTALDWIHSPPQRWKTFIAKRVAEVQACNPKPQWHHISGKINPADLASRGIAPTDIRNNSLWWNGPQNLHVHMIGAYNESTDTSDEVSREERKIVNSSHVNIDFDIITRYSSLKFLKRVTAWIHRFAFNSTAKRLNRAKRTGSIKASELKASFFSLIKQVQLSSFALEIEMLNEGKDLPKNSKVKTLDPFLDSAGVLRVGGRIRNSVLPLDRKHPLILPCNNPLTTLIIRDAHLSNLHAGPQLMLQILRENFWIMNGKNSAKYIYRKCVVCFRQLAKVSTQLMGDLPSSRVNPSPAFSKCGVDFAGPFLLRAIKGRGQKRFKAYVSVFVCFITRAIHLELVSDLSTSAFIATLKRFIGRRGKPVLIHSDCGTNFTGADRELRELQKLVQTSEHNENVATQLTSQGIEWVFNPPSAPHFGGLWEAGVKSMKQHLRRVVGNEVLNYEEMSTVLVEIEACLNSRPLCPLSDDPNDLLPLTPGHFLTVQHFWNRWSSEYLSRLQQRPKWIKSQPNLEINSLVLLKDVRLPKLQWKLGRITSVYPGPDGKVRVVNVKTSDGLFKRPITKVCLLPIETHSSTDDQL